LSYTLFNAWCDPKSVQPSSPRPAHHAFFSQNLKGHLAPAAAQNRVRNFDRFAGLDIANPSPNHWQARLARASLRRGE
jgi:hypothetical protein